MRKPSTAYDLTNEFTYARLDSCPGYSSFAIAESAPFVSSIIFEVSRFFTITDILRLSLVNSSFYKNSNSTFPVGVLIMTLRS